MSIDQHESFAGAYAAGLRAVLRDGREVAGVRDASSIGSGFGHDERATLELAPFHFRVRDPMRCLIDCRPRQPNMAYVVGQWIWVMAGSDELDRISYYNSRGRAFSDDGRRLPGAFGMRMRRSGGDQLERALDLLRRDPTSRRAIIMIAEPGDGRPPTRDWPCAVSFQLMVRDGALEAFTTMRSQSALMVLPYDAALFMTLHVWAAAVLGLPCGPHNWTASSFHVYADELELAEQVLADPPLARALASRVDDPQERLADLDAYECALRTAVTREHAPAGDVPLPASLADEDELHGAFAAVLRAYAERLERDASTLRGAARR